MIFTIILTLGMRGVFVLSDLIVGLAGALQECRRTGDTGMVASPQKLEVISEEAEEEAGLTEFRSRKTRRPL